MIVANGQRWPFAIQIDASVQSVRAAIRASRSI